MNEPDLAAFIRPGDTVLWGQAGAEPLGLTRALVAQRHRLGRPRVFLGIDHGGVLQPEHADGLDLLAWCGGGHNRALAAAGVLDILPCHYAHLPALMRRGVLRIDVVMLQVSPPDAGGRHSLGLASEYLVAALDVARVVLAEVNDRVPWTHGERSLRSGDMALRLAASYTPAALPAAAESDVERAVGARVAELVDDGATLQLGLGAIPRAALRALGDRRDLGIHSGAIDDGVADLMVSGVVNNRRKTIDRGRTVAGLLMGGERLHRFAHDNPAVQMRSTEYTHDPQVLASIDRFVAINSAIEVDLSGQVNAEVAAGRYVGAVGGAVDFLRGAHRSRGGLPVIALPSTAGRASRIVPTLSGPVSTPRSDAGLIVTEHGVADLRGQPLSVRRRRLIDIADPRHREALAAARP